MSRSPRLVLAARTPEAARTLRQGLIRNRCRVRDWAPDITTDTLLYWGIDAVVVESTVWDLDERHAIVSALPPRVSLIIVGAGEGWTTVTGSHGFVVPHDIRAILALIYRGIWNVPIEACHLIELTPCLAVVPALQMVFCKDRIVPFHLIERNVFCALLDARGSLVAWKDLRLGAQRGYRVIARMRRVLRNYGSEEEVFETVWGRGVRLVVPEPKSRR